MNNEKADHVGSASGLKRKFPLVKNSSVKYSAGGILAGVWPYAFRNTKAKLAIKKNDKWEFG